jgi:hypothetical protein
MSHRAEIPKLFNDSGPNGNHKGQLAASEALRGLLDKFDAALNEEASNESQTEIRDLLNNMRPQIVALAGDARDAREALTFFDQLAADFSFNAAVIQALVQKVIGSPDETVPAKAAFGAECIGPDPAMPWRRKRGRPFPPPEQAKNGGRPKGTPVNGENLRAFRGKLSQQQFADECGVSLDTIQRGEACGRWDEKTFVRVAENIAALTRKRVTPEDLKNRKN